MPGTQMSGRATQRCPGTHRQRQKWGRARAELVAGRSQGCSRECLAPVLPSLASTPWPEEQGRAPKHLTKQ